MRNQNTKPYDGPFPRPRHSHRCQACECAVYCYKSQCTKPQSEVECSSCAWHSRRAAAAAPAVVPAPAAVVPAFTLQAPGAPAPAQLSLFGGAE
jgi:hypothetical protein